MIPKIEWATKRFLLCWIILESISRVALAGDLYPPLGQVQATNRVQINQQFIPGSTSGTLPWRIEESGSYVLTGNIKVTDPNYAGHGIEIDADVNDVTLDLNGFVIEGLPGSGDGIHVNFSGAGARNITIFNGSVRGWGDDGIEFDTTVGDAFVLRVTDVRVMSNSGDGITMPIPGGGGLFLTHCMARGNGGTGFRIGGSSEVRECLVEDNGGDGIVCAGGCRIVDNLINRHCDGAGIHQVLGEHTLIQANRLIAGRIRVDSPGNLIVQNDVNLVPNCSSGPSYELAGSNTFGEIVSISNTGQIGANAWANFQD
ncbi:MAG: right-handed parallel beta-helix repeat-containing protein [Planctomycetes bacterium]|nr:right-handed parallel beta-helix repeat-containing protein [Planctomycetota bacterium]